ncbi:MAG TPA: hypothetical protein VGN64_05185, partial [Dyadobacter sp.]|nr:hypothetical protein [Dyadobacter sp.]
PGKYHDDISKCYWSYILSVFLCRHPETSSKTKLMKQKILIILIAAISGISDSHAQIPNKHILSGYWMPQSSPLSCWAATLSNVSRVSWESNIIPESSYCNHCSTSAENLDIVKAYAERNYNVQLVRDGSVLTWQGISAMLAKKRARPFIYSFKVQSAASYHTVNIFGYESVLNIDSRIRNWLYVYDPKPDSTGKFYMKNYLAYSLIHITPNTDSNIDNQGTFYNFEKTGSTYKKINNVIRKATSEETFVACLSDNEIARHIDNLMNKISEEFRDKIGLRKGRRYIIDKEIKIIDFEDEVINQAERQELAQQQSTVSAQPQASDTTNYQIVMQNASNSYMKPYVFIENDSLKFMTGVVIRNTKNAGEKCLVLDTIENIDFLNKIPFPYWNQNPLTPHIVHMDSSISLIRGKENSLFVKTSDGESAKFYDFNKVLSNDITEYKNETEFEAAYLKYRFSIPSGSNKILKINIPLKWDDIGTVNDKLPENLKINKMQHNKYLKMNTKRILVTGPVLD